MSVVWEDPPSRGSNGVPLRGRERSPLRIEWDSMKDALVENPGRWARLWDFTDKEDARKRAAFCSTKGFGVAVRETPQGYSVFGRFKGEPIDTEAPAERESTFQ